MMVNLEALRPAISMRAAAWHETTVEAARKRRQDALLDAALLETFPASDPVSVVRVA